ncbi:pilus assembly FimT family protein [Anaerosporobacter faecicola]|uniref:pilus assembly FimT family protein n=1 Tax=Anaerosporobacter faecicola TaxID=2718714 RepID=UPI00143C8797|nr:prepilin-type N-terminal cleavage/methylation domain-containing protein [Anaerosporobacter faecicola]
MKKENQGFTVIELLIVFAIVGILMLGVTMSFSSLMKSNVNQVSKTIDGEMKKLRIVTLSKDKAYSLFIYKRGSYYYYQFAADDTPYNELVDGNKLGRKDLEIQYRIKGSEDFKCLEGSDFVRIAYNASNGKYSNDRVYDQIRFVSNSRQKQIVIANVTGRHFIR